jgi:hypothetical protein
LLLSKKTIPNNKEKAKQNLLYIYNILQILNKIIAELIALRSLPLKGSWKKLYVAFFDCSRTHIGTFDQNQYKNL